MAGNSQRKGAIRKSSKGPTKGTGGKNRRSLEGKGPTPKAEDRPNHVAYKRKQRAEREAAKSPGSRSSAPRDSTPKLTDVVVGRNAVLEALRTGIPARGLLVFDRIDADQRITEIVELAVTQELSVREVPKKVLDALVDGVPHQGVALEVSEFDYADPRDLTEAPSPVRIVALDGIQDPRNLGAIVRSAAAFGASGVVIPERRAASMTVAAWKVSAGAAARLPVARATNLVRALKDYQKAGFFVVGLDAHGDVAINDCALLDDNVVIVVGAEGEGLSRLVRETCDQIASIPIAADTESLNASVAASVALYEASRR